MSERGLIRIRFWGVRGSHAVPGPSTLEVGGNTACVEVEAGGQTLIFDAGTGIIPLGRDLLNRSSSRLAHIFLSHTHHDHIEGLRFFEPAMRQDWRCFVFGYASSRDGLVRVLDSVMRPPVFPIGWRDFAAEMTARHLPTNSHVIVENGKPAVVVGRKTLPQDRVVVAMRRSRAHPKLGVTLYRVSLDGRTLVYASDVEAAKGGYADVTAFARGADVLVHDAHFGDDDGAPDRLRVGWGHSTVRMAAEVAKAAQVGELVLFHHGPMRTDADVLRSEREARAIFPLTRAAREGMELHLR